MMNFDSAVTSSNVGYGPMRTDVKIEGDPPGLNVVISGIALILMGS